MRYSQKYVQNGGHFEIQDGGHEGEVKIWQQHFFSSISYLEWFKPIFEESSKTVHKYTQPDGLLLTALFGVDFKLLDQAVNLC